MTTNDAVNPRKVTFSPNRLLLIIFSAVLLFTVAVVLATSQREPTAWKISTPQGVVQAYLKAMTSGDTDKAARFLSSESQCRVSDLDRAYVPSDMRIYLTSSTIADGAATVTVKVDSSSDGPFIDSMSEIHTLRLTRIFGNWRLVGIPWPLYDCGVIQK
jgi:hypothetical protein